MVKAVVFDAYGTLLNVHAAMERHANRLGPDWQAISHDWRTKQIEYSWVRSLAGPSQYRDFWQLTRDALDWAAKRHGVTDAALLEAVLQAYRRLDAYPDAVSTLTRLRDKGVGRAILSNGEPAMLLDAARSGGLLPLLDTVLSVDPVGVYKPDQRVYRLAETWFGLPALDMAFVSSNAWDAFGAACFGFRVFWIDRAGLPVEYGLDRMVTIVPGLTAVADALTGGVG